MILYLSIAALISLIITNVLAGILSAATYNKDLNKNEKRLIRFQKKMPGFIIGHTIARLKDKWF